MPTGALSDCGTPPIAASARTWARKRRFAPPARFRDDAVGILGNGSCLFAQPAQPFEHALPRSRTALREGPADTLGSCLISRVGPRPSFTDDARKPLD